MDKGVLEKSRPFLEQGDFSQAPEAEVYNFQEEYFLRRFGREVLELVKKRGYNNPLNYLYDHMHDPKADKKANLATDVAERLAANSEIGIEKHGDMQMDHDVIFRFEGGDFISVLEGRSMQEMLCNGPKTVEITNSQERNRSEIEEKEFNYILSWFEQATPNSYLVVESLPLGEEPYAISRVYERTEDGMLRGHYVSLHNSSIETFNQLRMRMGQRADYKTELEILAAPYVVSEPWIKSMVDFVNYYVGGTYDRILEENTGRKHSFGAEVCDNNTSAQNALEVAKKNDKLLGTFEKTVQELADSRGRLTPDLYKICDIFKKNGGKGIELREGQVISADDAKNILKFVMDGIVHTILESDPETLAKLNSASHDDVYETVVSGGGEASATGVSYGGACPSASESSQSSNTNGGSSMDELILYLAYGIKTPKNFGKPQVKPCNTSNCPSRKASSKSPEHPTYPYVGGCGFCAICHGHAARNLSQYQIERIYNDNEKKKREEEKQKQDEEERTRLENERLKWERRKAASNKQKLTQEDKPSNTPNQKLFPATRREW